MPLHLVMDNCRTRRHPRFVSHFVLTSSSRMNLDNKAISRARHYRSNGTRIAKVGSRRIGPSSNNRSQPVISGTMTWDANRSL